jgi:hypothetical protein
MSHAHAGGFLRLLLPWLLLLPGHGLRASWYAHAPTSLLSRCLVFYFCSRWFGSGEGWTRSVACLVHTLITA